MNTLLGHLRGDKQNISHFVFVPGLSSDVRLCGQNRGDFDLENVYDGSAQPFPLTLHGNGTELSRM